MEAYIAVGTEMAGGKRAHVLHLSNVTGLYWLAWKFASPNTNWALVVSLSRV